MFTNKSLVVLCLITLNCKPRADESTTASSQGTAGISNHPAAQHRDTMYELHLASAQMRPEEEPINFSSRFISSTRHEAVKAIVATLRFLTPKIFREMGGADLLEPTLRRKGNEISPPEVKQVHAIGTLAKAKLVVDQDTPYCGMLNKIDGTTQTVPMLIRFSVANPVIDIKSIRLFLDKHLTESIANEIFGASVAIKTVRGAISKSLRLLESLEKRSGYSAALEFIPGLGMKFFLDQPSRQNTLDLVAMESLAGQGKNHNFFLHEKTNDFSRKAPGKFNTESNEQKKAAIKRRYHNNPVNLHVMSLVGKRFETVMKRVLSDSDRAKYKPHSSFGPHPFSMSIDQLSHYDVNGKYRRCQSRPFRLAFTPSANMARAATSSSTTYITQPNTDFRVKLANLVAGDTIYDVYGVETDEKKVPIGKIVLESSPFPSNWSDQSFFIRHDIDTEKFKTSHSNSRVGLHKQEILELIPKGETIKLEPGRGLYCTVGSGKRREIHSVTYRRGRNDSELAVNIVLNRYFNHTSPTIYVPFSILEEHIYLAFLLRRKSGEGVHSDIELAMKAFPSSPGYDSAWTFSDCRNSKS